MNLDLLAIYKPKMVKGYTSDKSLKLEFSPYVENCLYRRNSHLMMLINFHIVNFIFAEVVLNNQALVVLLRILLYPLYSGTCNPS